MKKQLLFLGLGLALNASAQNPIPNPSFDDWIDYGNYSDPAGWGSNNYVSAAFGVKPVESDTVAVEGLSAKLVTKQGQNFSVPGVLCANGHFDVNILGCQYGFPCDIPFENFNGYGMYNPVDTDKAGITATIWKWDTIAKARQYIAIATVTFTNTNSQFEYFSVPFTYNNSETPDSALIDVRSTIYGGENPPEGSKLRVDNFEFSNYTAVENLQKINLSVYPNPANAQLSVHIPPASENLFVTVFDFTGRVMIRSSMPANEYNFSTGSFTPGIYYLRITDGNNLPVAGRTFEVQH